MGVGVFHAKGRWPKSSCSPSKVCLPWVSKRGIWDVLGILPGCPGPLGVFKNQKPPNVGAGACGIWGHREEAQRPLHETMHLAEARLERHAPGGSMPSEAPKHCKIQSRRDAPQKWPFWKHRAPKMRLVEAQCAHRKHCYPEIPLESHPTSRVSQKKLVQKKFVRIFSFRSRGTTTDTRNGIS